MPPWGLFRGPRAVRPRFPAPGGRSPRSPAGREARAGTRGPRAPRLGARLSGARFRLVRPHGGPGWVLSVPSAFREGDSATRSRVEKLPKTKNEGKELGRHHPLAAPRPRSRTSGAPHPHSPGIRHAEGRAALQPQCRGHAMRGRERPREEEAPCGSQRAGASPLSPPPPPLLSSRPVKAMVEAWIKRLENAGRGAVLPEISALEGGGCGKG